MQVSRGRAANRYNSPRQSRLVMFKNQQNRCGWNGQSKGQIEGNVVSKGPHCVESEKEEVLSHFTDEKTRLKEFCPCRIARR